MNPVSRSDGARYDVKADSRFFERIITQYPGDPITVAIIAPQRASRSFKRVRDKGNLSKKNIHYFFDQLKRSPGGHLVSSIYSKKPQIMRKIPADMRSETPQLSFPSISV